MRKRIVSVLLLFCLLVSLPLAFVSSADSSDKTDIRGIDYGRIHEGYNSASMSVSLSFGRYSVPGTLEAGNGVSRAEVNKIIRDVMAAQDISSDFLHDAQALIARTAKLYGISAEEFALAMAGDAGDYLTLAKNMIGEANTGELGGVLASLLTGAAVSVAGLEGASAFVVTRLASLGYSELSKMYEAHQNGEELTDITTAIIAAAKLAHFYNECNRRIDGLSKEGNARLVFGGELVEYTGQSFMGIPGNILYLKASGTMYMKDPVDVNKLLDEPGFEKSKVFTGTYRGSVTFTFWYDLSEFDSKFKDDIFLGDRLPFRRAMAAAYSTYIDTYSPTVLKKVLTCENAEVKIDGAKQRFGHINTSQFSLKGFEDNSKFTLDHVVLCVPDKAIKFLQKDGTFDFKGAGAEVKGAVCYQFWMKGNLADDRYAQLLGDRQMIQNNTTVTAPYVHDEYNYDKGTSANGVLITDSDCFWFLHSTPELKVDVGTFKDKR